MEEDIKECIEVLRKGGLILYPTDTIWGIGCDATNATAVKRIYDLKQRADNKAMLVLLDNEMRLDRYVRDVPEIAYQLIEVAVAPLTIIYNGAYNIAPNLLGDNSSIGIRITCEHFSQQLCRRFGKPIVSTSANISGKPAAATFAQIDNEIISGVDYVVKYRQNDTSAHKASSIIQIASNGTFKILRK